MLLAASEIRRSRKLAKAAFPGFTKWKHHNEIDGCYSGFSLWGEFVSNPRTEFPYRFFVTFDIYETAWKGHLSVGKHCYYWGDADFGDAYLVNTDPCDTLEEAIAS